MKRTLKMLSGQVHVSSTASLLVRILIPTLLAALLLCSCSEPVSIWDDSLVGIGDLIGVEELEGFKHYEYNDALSGIYYATWTAGEGQKITNDEGEEAILFDAQIYMTLRRFESQNALESGLEEWKELERGNYQTGEESVVTVAGQKFDLMPLLQAANDTNPFSHGMSAFGARGEWAICIELVCQDGYERDPETVIMDFLDGLHYNDGDQSSVPGEDGFGTGS